MSGTSQFPSPNSFDCLENTLIYDKRRAIERERIAAKISESKVITLWILSILSLILWVLRKLSFVLMMDSSKRESIVELRYSKQ